MPDPAERIADASLDAPSAEGLTEGVTQENRAQVEPLKTMEASNPTCPPSDDPLPPQTAVSEPGDPATEETVIEETAIEETVSVSDDGSPTLALEPSVPEVEHSQPEVEFSQSDAEPMQPEGEPSQPEDEFSQPEGEPRQPEVEFSQTNGEPGQHEPVDDLEVVQCLRCTALLPCYARYCLHCGASQEAPQVSDESPQAQPVPDDATPEVAPMDDAPPVSQVLPEDLLPETVSLPEPTFMDLLRAEQQRVVEKLVPLESDRYWWKKYF